MQRVKISLACLLCLSWAGTVTAQTELEPTDTGVATLQDFSGGVTLSGTYFDIRHLSGNGVGYTGGGYTQFGAFMPLWINDNMLVAPVGRMTVANNSNIGGSGGGVYRFYSEGQDRIYGVNAWYDFDRSAENFNYQQGGFGIETLGQWIDLRGNVYVPTNTNANAVRPLGLGTDPIFTGNGINFLCLMQMQQALRGADFEIGTQLAPGAPWLRGYAGAYAYDSPSKDPVGFRGRIDATVSNDLTLGVQVTNDTVYGTNVNAMVDFRFSGWTPTRYFPQITTRDRMASAVQRNWRMSVQNYNVNTPVAAANPTTGLPYFVVWVDSANNKPGAGNGTFENPYKDFQPNGTYPNADLILVRVGHSLINPYNGPIVLTDNQRLLGQGCAATFEAVASCGPFTTHGVFNIPGFNDTGIFPTITAPGNIVTIANHNEVAGFNLVNAGGLAITNDPVAGSNDFNLHCLNIVGNQGGIFLSNASGQGIIGHTGAPFEGVRAVDNTLGGISVSTNSALNLVVQNSSSNSTVANAQAFGLQVTANNALLNLQVNDFQADNNGAGFLLTGTNSDMVVGMNSVRLTNNQGFGLSGNIDGGNLALTTTNFTASDNLFDNVNLTMFNGTTMNLQFNDATLTGSLGGSGMVISNSGGTGSILVGRVNASFNANNGLQIIASDGAGVFTNIAGPFVAVGNGFDGLVFQSVNSSSLNVQAVTPIVEFNGRHGINFSAVNNSVLNLTVNGGALDFNGQNPAFAGSAINGFADFSTVNAVFNDLTGTFSGADGMFLQTTNGAAMSVTMANGSLQNSGQNTPNSSAIEIQSDFFSSVFLNVNNVALNNNPPPPDLQATQVFGLLINANNVSNVTANIRNSDLSDNLADAVNVTTANASQVNVSLTNSSGNRSGADGLRIIADTASIVNISANNSSFNDSGANGISAIIRNASTVGLTMAGGSTVDRSGQNGLLVDIANVGSSFSGSFQNSSVSDSGQRTLGTDFQDSMRILATDQALVNLSLNNTPTTNTVGDTPQQRALRAEITLGADLNYTNIGGNMSFNQLNAVSVAVDGFGSTTNIFIDGTPMNNSGQTGVLFFATNGGYFGGTIQNSSLDSSGADGVQGDGIRGLLNNSGTSILSVINTPITNALEDAVHIEAQDPGTTIVMTLDSSPLDNAGVGTSGNALDLLFLNGAVGQFTLQNGSTASGAGGDGLLLFADGAGTQVTVNAFGSNFSDASQTNPGTFSGINATVINNAITTLNFVDTPVTNTTGLLPELNGMLFTVQSSAQFFANFSSPNGLGTLSNHFGSGIVGTAITSGLAVINVDSMPIDGNQLFGAAFLANTNGDVQFNIVNGSVSNNGASGIFAQVDGAGSSFTSLIMNSAVNGNGAIFGGSGVDVTATNGASAIVVIDPSQVNSNANRGVSFLLDTGSTGYLGIGSTTVDNNAEEGIFAQVLNGSSLVMDVENGSVSNNSTSGNFDSVRVIASGAGTHVETLFRTVNVDQTNSSGLNGFNYTIDTGATVLAQFRDGTTSTGNLNGSGLRFVANGANAALVYMEGANDFSNNGASVVGTLGTPQAGAGVLFDVQNTAVGAIRFAGTASNNGNPLNTFADIDGDGDRDDDGVYVRLNNVNVAAVDVNGAGNVSSNRGDGIDINISNVGQLNTIVWPSTTTPPSLVFGGGNNAIEVNGVTIDGNGGNGINIVLNNTNLSGNILVNGTTSNNNAGDGLLISLTNVTGLPNVTVSNGGFSSNGGHGIDLNLTNSSLSSFNVLNNSSGAATALGFEVDILGDEHWLNYNLTPDPTVKITSLVYDVGPTGLTYATTRGTIGTEFEYWFGGQQVGFTSVNGLPVNLAQITQPGVVADGSTVMTLAFTDFDNADPQFHFDITAADMAANSIPASSVLAGATVTAFFSNGQSLTGVISNANFDGFSSNNQFFQSAAIGGITQNGLDGIHIEQVNSDINNVLVNNNLIDSNGQSGAGDGIDFAVVQNSRVGATSGSLVISNNTITNNRGDGFRLVAPTTPNTTIFPDFTNNTISTNTGTGINLQLTAAAQNLVSNFTGNIVNGNSGGPGLNIVTADNRNVFANLANNSFSSNAAQGVNINTGLNANVSLLVTDNIINGNANEGINLPLRTGSTLNIPVFTGNTIGTLASRNGGMGVRVLLPNNSTMNWYIGLPGQPANNITGNTDAGVGIDMSGNATGTLWVNNSTFSNTINGGDPSFDGDGLAVIVRNAAQLTGGVTTSTFSANVGDGARFDVHGDLVAPFPAINNFLVGGVYPGVGVPNNLFLNNGGDGLEFNRSSNGQINNVQILNSEFTGNVGDGIRIVAANVNTTDTYSIGGNLIRRNNNGIHLQTFFDADLHVDITSNVIGGSFFDDNPFVNPLPAHVATDRNRNDGILVDDQINAASDSRTISGTWNHNTIIFNQGDGIQLSSVTNGLVIGDLAGIDGNLIRDNDQNGIRITRPGTVFIQGNTIDLNGTLANLNNANQNAGIFINVDNSSNTFLPNIDIERNTIFSNFGDGIQYTIVQGLNGGYAQLTINDNLINLNSGRGIDMITRQSNFTQATITNNQVTENGLEGVYIVNTPSPTQDQFSASTVALLANGNVFDSPVSEIQFSGNQVIGNGLNSGLSTTGLVVRVGTSGASTSPFDAGGFAGFGGAIPINGSPYFASTFRGGVVMTVDTNNFNGNAGNDILFHSFVGTADPATTGGTWDATTFNPTGYQSDPLARLDVYFRNNTFNAEDVNSDDLDNFGGAHTRTPDLVAFYTNAEGVFKSRLNTATPAGPFTSANRARNATRQAARIPFFLAPIVSPDGGNYLYPGIGQSTFRVNGDTAPFFLDNTPYNNTNAANGLFLAPGFTNGEMPFGWGLIP